MQRPHSFLLVLAAVFTTGCVSLKRPVGPWADALDLEMPRHALAGATVGVECATGRQDERQIHADILEACKRIALITEDLGAAVKAAPGILPPKAGEDEAPPEDVTKVPKDFTLRFVDLGGHRDYGGWTLWFCIPTGTLFPCVEDIEVKAELQILDKTATLYARYPLDLTIKKIYGAPALWFLSVRGLMPDRGRNRDHRLSHSLLRYTRNILYTYRQRQLLGKAPLAAGAPSP